MAPFTFKIKIYLVVKVQITFLIAKKVTISIKYPDYANIFIKKNKELLKQIDINEQAIILNDGKNILYELIYSLGPIEIEILKTCIKTNLANNFIWPLKFLSGTAIFFIKKPDSSFCFCIHYLGLNILIIKNVYFLLLIGEFLDQLSQAKHFIYLNLTNAYHRIKIKESTK